MESFLTVLYRLAHQEDYEIYVQRKNLRDNKPMLADNTALQSCNLDRYISKHGASKKPFYHWYNFWAVSENRDSRHNFIIHLVTSSRDLEVLINFVKTVLPAISCLCDRRPTA